ncbi:MAG: AI-2E family transporter [Anaerolineales bacterium]|jgi:predicted PurR-regulated permease PerM
MNKDGQWSLPVRYLVFGLVALLLALVVWYARRIVEPLIIAAFTAYIIYPAVNYLTRRTRLSRKGAVNLVYIITLLVVIGTPASLTSLFFDESTQVITDILHIYNQVIVWLEQPKVIPGIPIDFSQFANQLNQFRTTFITSLTSQAIFIVGRTSLGAIWIIVILVAVYYFLAEWPRIRNGFIGSFPDKYEAELNELYQRVRRIWMSYLRGQIVLMLIVGVAFTIAWSIIGVPGGLVLGVIAGFLTLIPDVGPFLAAMLAVGVALLEGSTWSWMPASHLIVGLIVLATYIILISIKNFWVRPVIMGRSVQMHESLVLISILLATVLWGILGALIIVPVLASLVVILDYLRRRILGMPPFPPVEPFVLEEKPAVASEEPAPKESKTSDGKKG